MGTPAPGAGRAPQMASPLHGQPCSTRGRKAQGRAQNQQLPEGVRNPLRPFGATTPTQLSHPFTLTFHLHNHAVSRPKCHTSQGPSALAPRGKARRDHQGNPPAPCKSELVTLVVLRLKSGMPGQHGLRAQRETLPMNHGGKNLPLEAFSGVPRGEASCTLLV